MRTKSRKMIWPLPGMATFAIVAALAILVAVPVGVALAQNEAVMTAGSAPAGFAVEPDSDAGTTTLTLTWGAPAPVLMWDHDDNAQTDEQARDITAYRIDRSMDGGDTWKYQTHVADNAVEADVAMLQPGTTHHFRIYAIYLPTSINTNSDATAVEELISPPAMASGTTQGTSADDAPDTPLGFQAMAEAADADNEGAGRLQLQWTSASTDDAPLTYKLEYSMNNADWMPLADEVGSTTSDDAKPDAMPYGTREDDNVTYRGNHNGLTQKTKYYYRIRAVNADDVHSDWTTHSATTRAAIKPAVPQLLVAHGGPGKITLYWDASDDPAGAPITGYRIMTGDAYNDDGVTTDFTELVGMTPDADTMHVHESLSAGTKVYYRIYAINAAGDSLASNVAVGTATADRATDRLPAPEELQAGHTTADMLAADVPEAERPGKLGLNWGMVDDADHYMIQWSPDGEDGNWRTLVADTSMVALEATDASPYMRVSDTEGLHVDLMAETTYYYQVFAMGEDGSRKSLPSETATGTTTNAEVPAMPMELSATAVGTQINLTWKAPDDPAGAPVTGFRIDRMKKGGNWVNTANVGDVMSYSDAVLEPNTEYTYRIYAKNNGKQVSGTIAEDSNHPGRSMASTSVTETTGAGVVDTTLGEPTITSATGGTGSVTVAWTDGANAMSHMVLLLNTDFSLVADSVVANATSPQTISVASGTYIVVVLALDADAEFEYDSDFVTVN